MRHLADLAAAASWPQPAPAEDIFSQIGLKMTFARDEEIFAQGEEADLIYRLVSGAVRTTCLMADGRRQIGDFYYPGEFFGIETGQEHRFSAEALGDCTVVVLKRSAFKALADQDRDLERLFWAATAKALDRATDHLLLLGRKTACEKVASFLLDMANRQRTEKIALPMGRQDMADYLGLTIETISRMLGQLQSSAVVTFLDARHFRIANRDALARLGD